MSAYDRFTADVVALGRIPVEVEMEPMRQWIGGDKAVESHMARAGSVGSGAGNKLADMIAPLVHPKKDPKK